MRASSLSVFLIISAAFAALACSSAFAGENVSGAAAKDAGPIVKGVIQAYGGKEAIEAVKNIYAKADITAEMRKDTGKYVRYLERPRRLRVEIDAWVLLPDHI